MQISVGIPDDIVKAAKECFMMVKKYRCLKCDFVDTEEIWMKNDFVCSSCGTKISSVSQIAKYEDMEALQDDICRCHARLSDLYVQLADILQKSFSDSNQVNDIFKKAEKHMSELIDIRERELEKMKEFNSVMRNFFD